MNLFKVTVLNRKTAMLFFIIFFTYSVLAQKYGVQAGSHQLTDCPFDKVQWSFNYSIDYLQDQGKIQLTYSNLKCSHANAKYVSKGVSYSPQDLGLNYWPSANMQYKSKDIMYIDYDLYYDGTFVRSTKHNSVSDGQYWYIGQFGLIDHKTNEIVLMVGSRKIKKEEFDVSKYSIKITASYDGCTNSEFDVGQISKLVNEKNSPKKNESKGTEVVINGGSENSSSSSGNPKETKASYGNNTGNNNTGGSPSKISSNNTSGKMTDAEAQAYFNKNVIQNTPYSNTLTPSVAMSNFGNTLNTWAAQEQARKEREAMEKRQEQMEAANLRRAIAARKYLLSKFPDGALPLSSQTANTDEVYFFAYNYDPSDLEDEVTVFFVTNVFSVHKYKDGTWPSRDKLSFIKLNTNNGWALSGFYSSKEEAETQWQYFTNGMAITGIGVKAVNQQSFKPVYNSYDINSWGNITKPGSVATQSFLPESKYEEAETAYSNSDYALALTKLDEAESFLKTKEPKVLYLRIMSQMALINKDVYNDYAVIENARKNSNYYIDNFSKTIEEKYVDVINASKQLDQLPRSKEYFDVLKEQHLEKLRKEEEAKMFAEAQKRKMEEEERRIKEEREAKERAKVAKERGVQNARVIGYTGGKFAPLGICYYRSKHEGMGLYMSFRGLIEKDPKVYKNSSYRTYCLNAGITGNILHPVGWYMAAGLSNFNQVDLRNPIKPLIKDWGAGLDISTGLIIHINKIKLQLGASIYGWMDVPPEFCFGVGYGF